MTIIHTTLYRGGHAADPGYRSSRVMRADGRSYIVISNPDGTNVRSIQTCAPGRTMARALSAKQSEKVAFAIEAALTIHVALHGNPILSAFSDPAA